MNNYKVKYCADSVVYLSHIFTLKQLYKRYYDTGIFFKENSYLDKYGTNKRYNKRIGIPILLLLLKVYLLL